MARSLVFGRKKLGSLSLLFALAASFSASCGNEKETATTTAKTMPLQASKRFPVGSTFYLPNPSNGPWVLETAPAGNQNQVVSGNDGFYRFTPVVPGDYSFRATATSERKTLSVVADVPYEHFNYYQTTSLAEVNGEIWVSNLFDPHISRIDPTAGTVKDRILTGPWPAAIALVETQGVALVAHKAGDTVGFIDLEKKQLVDAVWVGDEPADIAVSKDGAKAYVSLATEDSIAVIDIAERQVIGRVATNKNATRLALSDDGSTLYVASYCSGVSERLQFAPEKRNDLYDIAVVDTASLKVRGYIESVGSTLGGLYLTKDKLYVATTRVAIAELSGQEGMTAFRHSVAAYDTTTLKELVSVDVGRQPSSTGLAVRPFGLTLAADTLWVTFEGNNLVVGLDPQTLAEKKRFTAEGRPRTILASGDRLFVHGAQAYEVTIAKTDGTTDKIVKLDADPRSAGQKAGQALYTGVGAKGGTNHSCADCHVDALTDGNVWSAGGFSESSSKPMFFMERESLIGWEGDAYDFFSYLYGSPGPTIGLTIDTEKHQAFYDYLSSVVPPPHSNGQTARDGSLSEAGRRGEALFQGKANCAGCHAGPLTTEGLRLDMGGTLTTHPVMVPSLIGAYRHGSWLVNGAAGTLDEALDAMLKLSNATLNDAEKKDVVQYLKELTPREFFVLSSSPRDGAVNARNAGEITITLSHPVFDAPDNLNRIELRDNAGAKIAATVSASERHITIVPSAPLAFGGEYDVVVGKDFEAFNERRLSADTKIHFTVAKEKSLKLEGDYTVTIDHPTLDMVKKEYVPDVTIPVTIPMKATSTGYGAAIVSEAMTNLLVKLDVTISDDVASFPPFPFPVGPAGFMNRSFPTTMTLVDTDGDGIADSGESTLMLRGPGLEAKGVVWRIKRDTGLPAACEGMTGAHAVALSTDAMGLPTVSWMDNVTALGYYVTDPDAKTPSGPGPVTGGTTYWALATSAFPNGFAGPIVYGIVPANANDVSVDSGAPASGAAIPPASCVKLTLVFSDFSSTVLRYLTP